MKFNECFRKRQEEAAVTNIKEIPGASASQAGQLLGTPVWRPQYFSTDFEKISAIY